MKILISKSKLWLGSVVGVLCVLNSTSSWASCKFFSDSNPPGVTVTVNLPKNLVIPRDAPIGSEVYRTDVYTAHVPYFRCDNDNSGGYVSNWGTSDSGPSPLGASGLGWQFFSGEKALIPNPKQMYHNGGHYFFNRDKASFRLYRLGEITSEVSAGNIGRYLVDGTMLMNFVIANTVVPVVSSCTTPSINVPLGKQSASGFKGVGSTIGEKAFSIQLNNCPAGIKSLSYRLDPVNTAFDAKKGILALNPGGATGVGIKITDNNGVAIGLGAPLDFLKNVAAGNYTIPLKAAYYKTSDTVVGGVANASMQFAITYQ